MAIEYTFWDERLPEALIHFGEPLRFNGEPASAMEDTLKSALLEAMTTLQAKAIARNPGGFTLLATGRVGTGGFYQAGQRALARLRGRTYQAEHTALPAQGATQDES